MLRGEPVVNGEHLRAGLPREQAGEASACASRPEREDAAVEVQECGVRDGLGHRNLQDRNTAKRHFCERHVRRERRLEHELLKHRSKHGEVTAGVARHSAQQFLERLSLGLAHNGSITPAGVRRHHLIPMRSSRHESSTIGPGRRKHGDSARALSSASSFPERMRGVGCLV